MKYSFLLIFSAAALLTACNSQVDSASEKAAVHTNGSDNSTTTVSEPKMKFQNKAHELVYQMTQKVGDYQKLRAKKDVTYTYTYVTPDKSTDRSTEKYIFDGEYSYADYQLHERTLPDLAGSIEQGYDGKTFWLRHQGKYIEDQASMKRVTFNRKTNFYWFTMFQKLMDPGLNYEFIKEEKLAGKDYELVKVSFDSTDGKPTDVYQLWINKETALVDQFLFTVADFGVIDTPYLMKLAYEKIDGMLIPSQRKYTKADWNGTNLDDQWIDVSWTDIQFDNKLSKSIFEKS